MQLYVGIDWAQKEHAVCLMRGDKSVVSEFVIEHSEAGFIKLRDRVLAAASIDEVMVGIETQYNGIVDFLLECKFTVSVIHPNTIVGDRKAVSSSGAKSDRADARLIARHLINNSDVVRVFRPDAEITIAISQLLAERNRLVDDAKATSQRIGSLVERHHPAIRELFSSYRVKIFQAFILRFPDAAAIQGITMEEIDSFLKGQSYTGKATAESIFAKISAAPRGSTGAIGKSAAIVLRIEVEKLQWLTESTKSIEAEIELCMEQHPDAKIFQSLPNAGLVSAASLLVMFGDDRERYKDAEEVASLNGLTPVTRASGQYRSAQFRYSCRKTGRATIHLWMSALMLYEPWTKTTYKLRRNEGKRHPHALRILGRSWIRIAYACWKNRAVYDPSTIEKRILKMGA